MACVLDTKVHLSTNLRRMPFCTPRALYYFGETVMVPIVIILLLWCTPSNAVLSGSGNSPVLSSRAAVDLGTTLVAVKFDRGVVVGADTRTSQGGTMVSHRYAHKIVAVTTGTVIARSGSAADTQQLADAARRLNEMRSIEYGMPLTVSQTAHWLRHQVYGEHGGAGVVSLLVAGYDDKPRIFSITPSGALLEEQGIFAVSGSGSTFILGHLDHKVQACENLDEDGALELCQQAIQLAVNRDGSSGGLIRLYVITAEGSREVTIYPDQLNDTEQEVARNLNGFAAAEASPMRKKEFDLSRQ